MALDPNSPYAGGDQQTNSIVDYLGSVGQDSSFANRSELARLAGINNYQGTADQNLQLLGVLRTTGLQSRPDTPYTPAPASPANQSTPNQSTPNQSTPSNPAPAPAPSAGGGTPSPVPSGGNQQTNSIVDYLKSVGQDSSFNNRAKLAQQYGIAGYQGTADQNTQLLNSIRSGSAPAGSPAPSPAPEAQPAGASPTPAQPSIEEQNRRLAEIAGSAGLTLKEFKELQASNSAPTAQEIRDIADELGITELEASAFKKPTKTTQQLYDEALTASGLTEIRAKVLAIDEEIARLRKEQRDAVAEIDENPFLTEKSRVGRGRRAYDQAQGTIDSLLEQKRSYNEFYDKGIQQINDLVARQQNDFGINQAIDEAKLNYLNKKLDTRAEQLKNERMNDLGSLEAFLEARPEDTSAPDRFGSPTTGYYVWDKDLQEYRQIVAPTGKSGSGSSGSGSDDNDPLSLVDIKRIEELYGFTPPLGASFSQVQQFILDNPNASPAELQQAIDQLNLGSNAGTPAGAPQSTPAGGGQSVESPEQYLRSQLSENELKKLADATGSSSIFRKKSTDINNFFAEQPQDVLNQIVEAVQAGHSIDSIVSYLKSK